VRELHLRQSILDELEFEPAVNAAHIGVAVDDGVVTLTGHVRSYSEKVAALRAVRRVRGVRAIADEIHIRIPDGETTADDQIATRAAAILCWGTSLPSNAVQVTVRDGWVTLTGNVDWYYQRVTAEEDVHRLAGVRGVTNNITVSPRLRAEDVQRRIVDALKRNAQIDADQIEVAVENGTKVVLRGQVKNWEELHAVETAAWSAPGVKSVEDQLVLV
jgi:osmotically-inducible protein OsmY